MCCLNSSIVSSSGTGADARVRRAGSQLMLLPKYLNAPRIYLCGMSFVSAGTPPDFCAVWDAYEKQTEVLILQDMPALRGMPPSAYTAMVVGGVDKDKILHIVDVRRDRWDSWGIIEEIFSVHKRWNPDIFRFESENIDVLGRKRQLATDVISWVKLLKGLN